MDPVFGWESSEWAEEAVRVVVPFGRRNAVAFGSENGRHEVATSLARGERIAFGGSHCHVFSLLGSKNIKFLLLIGAWYFPHFITKSR